MTMIEPVVFQCCDTEWRLSHAPEPALQAAKRRALAMERRLNAFRPDSAVTRLASSGRSDDPDIARIVARGLEYLNRTDGAFDIRHGTVEHAIKAHIRGGGRRPTQWLAPATVVLADGCVRTDAPLDLNGLAKGYMVDRVHESMPSGLVDGGGDIASPPGLIGIENPYGPGLAGVLDTRWNIATSGRAKRRRGAVEHLYAPRDGNVGARHDQVTVVAARDCMEADALATTLSVMSLAEGQALVEGWPGLEALWVTDGKVHASPGFEDHVWHQ